MFNFFANENNLSENGYIIDGADYNHMINVLRMKIGEEFYISFDGKTDLCALAEIFEGTARAEIVKKNAIQTELPVKIHLFFGIPKGDKTEDIITKSVELGVSEIHPVTMKRCVVKIDEKKKKSKTQRWQAIAEAAAKQSKRNIIPNVTEPMTFGEAMSLAKQTDLFLVPYESEFGMKSTADALEKIKPGMNIGILIGPEGGFEPSEIEKASESGGRIVSLGSRILRVDTAALTAVSMVMLKAEMGI